MNNSAARTLCFRSETRTKHLDDKIFSFWTLKTGNFGGASRDRTDDPLLAKQVLSQLSYGP